MPRPYTIKAHPTTYAGVRFRSRLEARWAAFFDMADWSWQYEPIDLAGWSPDFAVTVICDRYLGCPQCERRGYHSLYAEVKPYTTLEEFHDHTAWSMMEGHYNPAPAVLGVSPAVSFWYDHDRCASNVVRVQPSWDRLWKQAGNAVQWRAA